mmetsp:Transcript_35356/g.60049  ORF Transcript_35356/g.60049 Transcript_35356/m.60049 type:complete len:112 (-) Transcript_35356:430-765(-)
MSPLSIVRAHAQRSSWNTVALNSFRRIRLQSNNNVTSAVGAVPGNYAIRSFSEDSRLHSTDIAFKPAESGWGGGSKYTKNFDNIFGSSKTKEEVPTTKNQESIKNDGDSSS